ncbi:hypothetical protein CDAR_114611 [Caerostris darwini]|uniref:Secreted protein n=1 Tax=Caerostris darwini TaxID=1538125 RepID=A0AAV4QY86_9ARAC|nr:hypothetical protein CDAR_114611 [Caerostris darwini]
MVPVRLHLYIFCLTTPVHMLPVLLHLCICCVYYYNCTPACLYYYTSTPAVFTTKPVHLLPVLLHLYTACTTTPVHMLHITSLRPVQRYSFIK